MTDGALPKPPRLVRATVVATLSDGSRLSWVIEGDEGTYVTVATEVKWEEVAFAADVQKAYVTEQRTDLTFTITDSPHFDEYHVVQGAPREDEPPAIEPPQAAVEAKPTGP